MPKTITSPVEKFPGTVTISDPMRIDQAQAVERALHGIRELRESKVGLSTDYDAFVIPAILANIEDSTIPGVDKDFVPASPRAASSEMINWLFTQILRVWNGSGEVQDPNE